MNVQGVKTASSTSLLVKADPAAPCLFVTGRDIVSIKAGTEFAGHRFDTDTPVQPPSGGYQVGSDYAVAFLIDDKSAQAVKIVVPSLFDGCLGGFHFAPGGNATARKGGDDVAAINPFSLWDINFRPSCNDPRGMVLVQKPGGQFWCDIYLLSADHLDGTSRFGVTIADGNDRPADPATGKKFKAFDYAAACAVVKHHGKGLLSFEEFAAAAYGVTEKSACGDDPETTKLDAARTSKFGLMQATGNMWIWGHDGDPDEPRPSIFGGYWWLDDHAGSRYASVDYWDDGSNADLGARGRSDHLQPA